MPQFKRILFATDFSETSTYATEYALLMARTFGAELHVLHVVETEVPIMMDGMVYLPPHYFDEIEKITAERLESVIAREDRDKLSVTLVMRRGAPFLQIIRYANDQKMDLIVLGTHGRGALAHVFLGNVAEKVVRQASCPVLTVRHPKHEVNPG
jgi:nucleotide-binding universal stress UspA family protein